MRNKIIITVCVLAVIGLAFVGYKSYQSQAVQERIQSAKIHAQEKLREYHQKAAVEAEKRRIANECNELQANYDAQPLVVRQKSERPQCDLKIVE